MLSSAEMYKKYEKLIMKSAWKYLFQTGLEYEDLYSEFKMVFCQVYHNYDPNKGGFSTILVTSIKNHATNLIIKNMALKRKNEVKLDPDVLPEVISADEEYGYCLKDELLKNENETVRISAAIIFNITYDQKYGSPKKWLRGLLKRLGFDNQEITLGFDIIKGML